MRLLQEYISGNACSQGLAFALLLSTVPSSTVPNVPGRVLLSCIIQDFRDYLVQRRPALRCLAGISARGRLQALCSAELWFMHVGTHLKPQPLRSEIRPNSVSLAARVPAGQSRTPDRTLRLCYQGHACSSGLSS